MSKTRKAPERRRRAGVAYLSGSFSSKTLRLVWSRMTLMLMKQPRSSFLARNIDILGYRINLAMVVGRLGGADGERRESSQARSRTGDDGHVRGERPLGNSTMLWLHVPSRDDGQYRRCFRAVLTARRSQRRDALLRCTVLQSERPTTDAVSTLSGTEDWYARVRRASAESGQQNGSGT